MHLQRPPLRVSRMRRSNTRLFREAFLQRFGHLQATSWRDVQQLFANPQRSAETASDFISRLARIAKRVKIIDDQLLQHAILACLKPVDNNADNDGQRRRVCFNASPPCSHSPSPCRYNWNKSSRQLVLVRDSCTTILDNATGAVLFTVIISVQLRMLGVIIAVVLVTFRLSGALADVLTIVTEGTQLPSIQH